MSIVLRIEGREHREPLFATHQRRAGGLAGGRHLLPLARLAAEHEGVLVPQRRLRHVGQQLVCSHWRLREQTPHDERHLVAGRVHLAIGQPGRLTDQGSAHQIVTLVGWLVELDATNRFAASRCRGGGRGRHRGRAVTSAAPCAGGPAPWSSAAPASATAGDRAPHRDRARFLPSRRTCDRLAGSCSSVLKSSFMNSSLAKRRICGCDSTACGDVWPRASVQKGCGAVQASRWLLMSTSPDVPRAGRVRRADDAVADHRVGLHDAAENLDMPASTCTRLAETQT